MIDIIYENDDFLAINKPAGVLVHRPEKGPKSAQREGVLSDWIEEHYPETKGVGDLPAGRQASQNLRPGIVHRLDEDTSGVLLIAKNQRFFEYLKGLFQKHEVLKTYLTLVHGRMIGRGKIDKPIGLKSGSVKRSVNAKGMKMVKEAITEYQVIKLFKRPDPDLPFGQTGLPAGRQEKKGEFKYYSLLRVFPHTGRTHQIRVHLASIGHPIVGDELYGRKKENRELKANRQFLHAESVEFNLEDGSRVRIEAELPSELQEFLENLNNSEQGEF
ncbi:MAG: RluA family pseudouridine synthase [Minisyncoccia bacterium]|jgi:23S rRNA pseudouridine1911/1915/1917 synthase